MTALSELRKKHQGVDAKPQHSSSSLERPPGSSEPVPAGDSPLGVPPEDQDGGLSSEDGATDVLPSNATGPGDGSTSLDSQVPRGVAESVTPSGIQIYFQAGPKRLYKVNGKEVPSMSNVLSVLDKPALIWWGQGIGVAAVLQLVEEGFLQWDQ